MLQRVSIQNFKSLKDVSLDLQKVNLLIGPNNSGKTNFLKALEFAKSLTEQEDSSDLFEAFRMGNGLSNLQIELNLKENFFYETQDTITFSLFREFFPLRKVSVNLKYKSINEFEKSVMSTFSTRLDESFFSSVQKNEEMNDNINSFLHIKNVILKNIRLYSPNPTDIILPRSLFSENIINKDCSNLISFINTFSNNYKNEFRALESDFSRCVEEFTELSTPPINTPDGGKLSLKFFDKYGHSYWGKDVSEGVLYFLALLCIIHQPDPPKILLLEEPEKGIHPRRIHEVMNFIFRLADEKNVQIILTSHSPIVLDEFVDIPESVFIFDKDEEGATQVKNLLRDVIEPETQKRAELGLEPPDYLEALGESWKIGFLGGVPK